MRDSSVKKLAKSETKKCPELTMSRVSARRRMVVWRSFGASSYGDEDAAASYLNPVTIPPGQLPWSEVSGEALRVWWRDGDWWIQKFDWLDRATGAGGFEDAARDTERFGLTF